MKSRTTSAWVSGLGTASFRFSPDDGQPNSANLYTLSDEALAEQGIELLPANLLDATRELEHNEPLRKAFGATPAGDYVDYFIKVKRREWQAAHEQITDWELDRYLQLF